MSVLELQTSSGMGIHPVTSYPNEGSDKPVVRLREPRDLYSTTSLQHPPKWPIECQVIPERIAHIETVPSKLEPFYMSSNSEPQPKPVGEEMGTILYDYQPKLSVDYFCRSCVGGSEALQTFESEVNALKFESRFESGNLAKAIKVTNVYYELYLRQDMYTDRHSQWFYFRIQNTKDNLQYRFSIVNFNKPDSLYRYGLKILMYSEKEAQLNKVGWVRCGQNIAYFKNDTPSEENGMLYTLTFNLKFRHNNDTVYLAHCYPYTYSMLQNYLRTIEDDSLKSEFLTVRLLCRSLAGNNVYIVTITSPDNYQQENLKKPAVVISARVHPGETQSSYMMKGIIDFLTSNSPQAQELRERFIFKLIPMLNPDGVIVGNSRCCLLGQDLNRQYRTVLREAFPQIYHKKVMMRRLVEDNGVFLYCDIHGHSRRNNVFIYGCENRKFPERKLIEQVFPLMMHKNSADKFSFQNCKFRVQKNKEGTGRVFAWTLGVVNSYTLEISLGGSTMQSRQFTHFNTADYEAVGRHFCETLMDFSDPNPLKERLRERILLKLMEGGSNADEPVNVPLTDYSSLSHSESEDSCNETTFNVPELGGSGRATNSIKRKTSFQLPQKKIRQLKSDLRPSLNLSKASVDFIRIGQSQKSSHQMLNDVSEEVLITKELAVFKRLTKFRRKTRKPDTNIDKPFDRDVDFAFNSPTCTRILFDDPFNPPGAFRRGRGEAEEVEEGEDSQSEEECDEHDAAITNKTFAQLGRVNTQLNEDFALFSISKKTPKKVTLRDSIGGPSQTNLLAKKSSTTLSSLGPFIPKLPQGKPLRSFYSMESEDKSNPPQSFKSSSSAQNTQNRRSSIATTSLLTPTISKGNFFSNRRQTDSSINPPSSLTSTSARDRKSSLVPPNPSKSDNLKDGKSSVGGGSNSKSLCSVREEKGQLKKTKTIIMSTRSYHEDFNVNHKTNERTQQVLSQATDLTIISKKKRSKFKKSKTKKNDS